MSNFRIQRPDLATIQALMARLPQESFSYEEVGATRYGPPSGYFVDRHVQPLGVGAEAFRAACQALRSWQMFATGWTELYHCGPAQVGQNVVLVAGKLGVWTLNSCRVVYWIDHPGDSGSAAASPSHLREYGFAYGTLPTHVAKGEEVFKIVWDPKSDLVHYEVSSFSWPSSAVSMCALPLLRRFQQQFRTASGRAMLRAQQAFNIGPANSSAAIGTRPESHSSRLQPNTAPTTIGLAPSLMVSRLEPNTTWLTR